jgi:Domain of unknown function (DUF6894)
MQTYRFVIEGRPGFQPVAMEVASETAAWQEARLLCGELVKDELEPSSSFRLLVLDGNGKQLFQIGIEAT